MECLFCSIVAGEIPSDIVLERDEVIAFRDIAPAASVHILVVPRTHIDDVRGITDAHGGVLAAMIQAATEVAHADGLADGYRLVFNVGEHAGQTVHHLHLHVLGG